MYDNIEEKINTIESSFKDFLDYLIIAEGNVLERNEGESDITAPLGIYRKDHPEAEVFKYIDTIASSVTKAISKEWSISTIKTIDSKLDKRVTYYLAYLFYKEFLKNANISLYHKETAITVGSLYVNGPALLSKSVQLAVNFMVAKQLVNSVKGKPIAVDGVISATGETSKELINIRDFTINPDDYTKEELQAKFNHLTNLVFDLAIMSFMKSKYIDLDVQDEARYGKFLDGWDNRVNYLMNM